MENLDHTEEEFESQVDETTVDDDSTESVNDFETSLEEAETAEDFARLAEEARMAISDEATENQDEEPVAENDGDSTIEEPLDDGSQDEDSSEDEGDTKPQQKIVLDEGLVLKNNGVELVVDDIEKIKNLAQQGLDYAKKTTELAKYRSFVQFAEENGISLEDIQTLKEIKSGNKEAIGSLIKKTGIDIYDIPEEPNFEPGPVQLPPQIDPEIELIADEILANEEYTKQFQYWVREDRMPPEIVQQVTTDPNALRAVKADIEAGVFDKAMREAYANMTLNGVDFNTAYINAKEVLLAQKPVVEQPRVTRGDRVRASASRGKASEPSRNIGVGTIADMSDDEFLENLNDLIASARPKN